MKTIWICGGKETNTAVKVLTSHLQDAGHMIIRNGYEDSDVCIGWGHSRRGYFGPMLNAEVNQYDKYNAFRKFAGQGCSIPVVFPATEYRHYLGEHEFPWLARNVRHQKGTDVIVCKNQRMVLQAVPVRDFFSVWIPTETEYRVWVFRENAFAIYEKVYKGEGEYDGYMRNHAFGFKFELRENKLSCRFLCNQAINAVKALDMDFGAVDIIEGKDGKFYVLEVNSMPAIDSIKRVSGVRLAKYISNWAEHAD